MTPDPAPDTEHRDFPICPYCGIEQDVWHEKCLTECHECHRLFPVYRNVTVTYTTKKL